MQIGRPASNPRIRVVSVGVIRPRRSPINKPSATSYGQSGGTTALADGQPHSLLQFPQKPAIYRTEAITIAPLAPHARKADRCRTQLR
jgi:hypothetical protein